MGLSSCIKKAEQFIKKQRNNEMRSSGKAAADKLFDEQTAALESLKEKIGDVSALNSDDAAAADAIRSAIEDLFIDRESLEIQVNEQGGKVAAAPFSLEDLKPKVTTAKTASVSATSPIMRRDDIVGAIMRVTGGKGIAPVMAGTLVGDSANNATKLRGLFRNGGWEDMSDLAELLSVEEGYDVRDASHLEELVRESAAGNLTYSMARMERDKSEGERRQYVDEVNQKAVSLGLKGVRGKRTLEVVESDIAAKEKEISELEANEERAAILASDLESEIYKEGSELTEADLMQWLGDQVEYTQEEIDEANSRAFERENRLVEANAGYDSEGQEEGRVAEGDGTGTTESGARGTSETEVGDGVTFKEGKGLAKGKWFALSSGEMSDASDTKEQAVDSLNRILKSKKDREDRAVQLDILAENVASKIKSGVQPTDKELYDLFGLENRQDYVYQEAVGAFVVKHFGVSRNKIHESLGKAGGIRRSDFGGERKIAYPRKLHEVFGKSGFDLSAQTNEQAAQQFAAQQEGESDQVTKEQADRERDAVPFSMEMQSQPKPQGVQTGLFTADGRVSSDAKSGADTGTKHKSADAGEELTYNKRNRRKDGIKWDEIADKNDALKAKEVVKAKVYPKPDYEALIAGGMKPVIAHMVKQMYDGIASAPKLGRGEVLSDASMKAYIDGVNRVMDGVMAWANDSQAIASWAGRQVRMSGQSFSVMDTFSKNDTPLTFVYPNGWKERQAEVRYLGGNKFYGALQPGYDEVARFLKDQKMGWPAKADLWKKQGYKIVEATGLEVDGRVANRRDGSTSVFAYLSSKGAGRSNAIESLVFDGAKSLEDADVKASIDQRLSELEGKYVVQDKVGRLVGAFDSMEEAEQGAKDATKREQDSGKVKEIGRVVTEVERIGADRRMEGQNVTAQELIDTFGFRGINFGNSMQGDSKSLANERQLHLNHIYDSFLDLAEILNVPPKAMSLNGMLGIAVGAQGSGKALAHFVPGVNEINITRRAGAGALAHEWGHALDHYFANMAGASTKQRPYMTELVSGPKNETVRVDGQWVTRPVSMRNVRQEVADQFRSVVDAMKKRSETEEERKKRLEDGKEKAMSGIKQWMDYFRREVSQVKGVDNSEYIKAIDVAESRINNMDFGDGVIAVSKYTEVHPVVADIKNAVEKATGVAPKTDNLNAVSIYIDRAKAFDGALKSTESHDPQIVDTNYLKASKSADGKKQKDYWSSTLEMFARALDAYVVDSLKELGNKNEYLSGIEAVAPYGEERKAINKAFDFLFAELKSKETENGIALYSDSANYAANGEYRTFDDYYKAQASAFNGRPEVERTASVSTNLRADDGIANIRRRAGSVLANGVSADFRDRSATKLTGKVIRTPEDLAVAAQVYRNPKFETARYFFIKDGVVVGQTAVSSRKPGVTKALVGDTMFDQVEHIDDIADQASSLGADSIWLLHNHPDGKPIPSEPDVKATIALAGAFESRGFKVPYHVIINNKSYGVLNVGEKSITGSVNVFDFGSNAQYSIDNPKVSHALLGSMIYSPTDLALNAKKAQVSPGQVVIIGLSGGDGIRTISEVTPSQLRGKFGAAILRRISRQTGSDRLFAYGVAPSDMSSVQSAIKSGLLADAIVVEDGVEMSVIGMSPSLKKRDGYSLGTKDSGVTVEMGSSSNNGDEQKSRNYNEGVVKSGDKDARAERAKHEREQFWRRLGEGDSFTGDEYVSSIVGSRGDAWRGAVDASVFPGGRGAISWVHEIAGFKEGYVTYPFYDAHGDFNVVVVPLALVPDRGLSHDSLKDLSITTMSIRDAENGDLEFGVSEPNKGTTAFHALQEKGKIHPTGQFTDDGKHEYYRVDIGHAHTVKLIQETIRRYAINQGSIGAIKFGRDTGSVGGKGVSRRYTAEEIKAKFAKDAVNTNVSPAQVRSALTSRFGEKGIAALEKTGMLNIMRLEDAPESIKQEAEEQGASALYTQDGVAYLFSDRMNADEAPGKLLHEIGEHHGLENMLGAEGWGRMRKRIVTMAKIKGSVAFGAWDGVKAKYNEFDGMSDSELSNNDRFLHEVLAAIGENQAGLKTSLWRELVAQVKEWLASNGFFTESITEGDIANLVSGSLKKVMRKAESGLVAKVTMSDIAYDYFKDIVSAMKFSQLLIEDCA